jgi:hypothetical protein
LSPRDAETVENDARRVGTIERVKVNAGHFVIEKIVALLQCEVNAHATNHRRIVFAALQRAQ